MIPWETAWTEIIAKTWKTIADEFARRIPHALISDMKALTPVLWARVETIKASLQAEGVTENGVRFYCNQLLNAWAEMITVQEKATNEMIARGMPPPKPLPCRLRISRAGVDKNDLSIEWVSVDGIKVDELDLYLQGQLEVEDVQALIQERHAASHEEAAHYVPQKIVWEDEKPARPVPTASRVLGSTEDTEIYSMPDIQSDD